jgi:hypothetical protein
MPPSSRARVRSRPPDRRRRQESGRAPPSSHGDARPPGIAAKLPRCQADGGTLGGGPRQRPADPPEPRPPESCAGAGEAGFELGRSAQVGPFGCCSRTPIATQSDDQDHPRPALDRPSTKVAQPAGDARSTARRGVPRLSAVGVPMVVESRARGEIAAPGRQQRCTQRRDHHVRRNFSRGTPDVRQPAMRRALARVGTRVVGPRRQDRRRRPSRPASLKFHDPPRAGRIQPRMHPVTGRSPGRPPPAANHKVHL